MKTYSIKELNDTIGRTESPPDLLTVVDYFLRETYTDVYAHPISLNVSAPPWPTHELGYIVTGSPPSNIIGIIHADRVMLYEIISPRKPFHHSNTRCGPTIYCTDPSFFNKIAQHIENQGPAIAVNRRS